MITITRLVLILAAISAIGPLSIDMYLPALPQMAQQLDGTVSQTQLTLSAFFVGMALGQLLWGPLSDTLGRRPVLLGGMGCYAIASLGCALSPSIEVLTALRFVQALAAGAAIVASRAVIRDRFGGDEVAKVLSMVLMVMAVAPLIAPILGALVLIWFEWPAIFLVLFGLSLLLGVLAWQALPESLPLARRQPFILSQLIANYGRLLQDRALLGLLLSAGAMFGALFSFISAAPFVYIDLFGFSETEFSLLFAVSVLTSVISSHLNRRLLERFHAEELFKLATGYVALASVVLVGLSAFKALYPWGTIAGLMLFFLTLLPIAANALSCAMNLHPEMAGTVSGLFGVMQFGFGALMGALTGLLYNQTHWPMVATIAICGVLSWGGRYITPVAKK
ncbi:Bcr/CflA family drug resistance efflux transporter [Ectothiorhodospiraceae bacterium BW-2]|nr:Bcr/CflA family drug resistance efflux transporter [Ectothiorhodospiraceae bacterium BW-2]